jgi:hypothetical protein
MVSMFEGLRNADGETSCQIPMADSPKAQSTGGFGPVVELTFEVLLTVELGPLVGPSPPAPVAAELSPPPCPDVAFPPDVVVWPDVAFPPEAAFPLEVTFPPDAVTGPPSLAVFAPFVASEDVGSSDVCSSAQGMLEHAEWVMSIKQPRGVRPRMR